MKPLLFSLASLLATNLVGCWAFLPLHPGRTSHPLAVPSSLKAHSTNPNDNRVSNNNHNKNRSLLVSHPCPVPGPTTTIPSRAQQVSNLATTTEYDVLVIGGGATGCGVALDCQSRGLQVACIERGDFASETSSRSTKLIWAGLKYLATAFAAVLSPSNWFEDASGTWQNFVDEFRMVLHCHEERRYMTHQQQHLVYWLAIAVPFDTWIKQPAPFGHPLFALFPLLAPFVFWFYDAMSGFTCPSSYIMTNDMARHKFPQLTASSDDRHLKYSMVFYEGHHNDARTNLAIALTAAHYGAHVCNYMEMTQLILDESGKAVGAHVLDRMTGNEFEIRAKKVVLAGGPFTDRLRQKEVASPKLQVEIRNNNDNGESNTIKVFNGDTENGNANGHAKVVVDRIKGNLVHEQANGVYNGNVAPVVYGCNSTVNGQSANGFYGNNSTVNGMTVNGFYGNNNTVNGVPLNGNAVNNNNNNNHQQQAVQTAVEAAWGTHIVLPGHFIPTDMGLLDYYTSDGRFLFIAPWQGHTLVGTTDRKGPAQSLHLPPEEDIIWLVQEAQKYLRKDCPIQRSDVLSAWRGWRPLASDPHHHHPKEGGQGQVSRDHVVSENPETGVVFVAGGKWTTWREMAQDVTDHIVGKNGPRCTTKNIILHGGGAGYSNDLPRRLVETFGFEDRVARHLAGTYGSCAWHVGNIYQARNNQRLLVDDKDDYPYLQAEVLYACQEYACTVEDILSRRTRLAYLNKEKALEALPVVAELMANELGWSSAVKENQIEFARVYINSFGGPKPVPSDTAALVEKKAEQFVETF